jgi:hypothetical protein
MGRSFTKAIKSAEMQGVLKQIPPDAAQAMGQTNTVLGNIVKASGVATPVVQPVASLQFDNEERAKRVEGSLGRAAFGPERIREILMQLKGLNFLADGGRVGYQAGGPATPEQYAAALQQVSAGPASQQVQSLGEYLKNYSTSVDQSINQGIQSLYGGPKLAEIATAYNRERNLPTATGEISNLRHSTAFSQFRDKLAQAAGMASPVMFGINQAMGSTAPNTLQQAIGTIGASIAGIGTEIPQLATKPSEAIEDIKANLTGITQIPTGLSVPEGYEAAQKIYSPSQQLDALADKATSSDIDSFRQAIYAANQPTEGERFSNEYLAQILPESTINSLYDQYRLNTKNYQNINDFFGLGSGSQPAASAFSSIFNKPLGYGLANGGSVDNTMGMSSLFTRRM